MLKYISQLIRLGVAFYIYAQIFNQNPLTYRLCGPLTIRPAQQLYLVVCIIQIIRNILPVIAKIISGLSYHQTGLIFLLRTLTFKYLVISLIKLSIIFNQSHRWIYYLHVGLLEIVLLIICILIDVMKHQKISQVAQILIIDTFNVLVTMYQLTRTFCPNFAIYWFICNFFVLMVNQIEGHSQSKKQSLYVKYDIYRIFLVFIIYFAIFSAVQAPSYGYKMVCAFFASIIPFKNVLKYIDQGHFGYAIINIIIGVIGIIIGTYCYEYYNQ